MTDSSDSIFMPDLARPRARTATLLRAAWFVLLLSALAYQLGGYPLFEPDEGRNAEVAREMVATGDYLVPHFNGLPYLDKPVLFFSLDALALKLLGPSELVMRLPSLLFALATAALVAWFAARLFGRESAWIAATAAAAAPLAVALSRTVIFDSLLAFLLTLGLMACWFAVEARVAGRSAVAWSALAWVAMGLGVLTKGPVALAVVLLPGLSYALWRRAGRALWMPLGPLLFLALVLPWIWAMSKEVPEFLHYALVSETWRRMTTDQFERTGPVWYFLPTLLVGALPWSFVALGAGRRLARRDEAGRRDPRVVFLLLWLALPFVLFSLSHSKRPQYILPLLPAVALLVAAAWREKGEEGRPLPGARAGAGAWVGMGVLLVAAAFFASRIPKMPAGQAGAVARAVLGWGLAALLGGIAAWLVAARREAVLVALSLPALAMPFLLTPLLQRIGDTFSSRDVAAAVAPYLSPEVAVVGVRAFPTSLPFYLGRTIMVAGPRGRELTSNYIIDSYAKWLDVPGTPLRSMEWWSGALSDCSKPMLFVAHSEDRPVRATLAAAGLPLRYEDDDFAAYGPCQAPARPDGR